MEPKIEKLKEHLQQVTTEFQRVSTLLTATEEQVENLRRQKDRLGSRVETLNETINYLEGKDDAVAATAETELAAAAASDAVQ